MVIEVIYSKDIERFVEIFNFILYNGNEYNFTLYENVDNIYSECMPCLICLEYIMYFTSQISRVNSDFNGKIFAKGI